jgi:pentatricopeptide repeat protein
MSKDKIQLLSPLFLKYQADYEKNPRSRVFAPLAETYRKLGMTDKAMEILSQGIRYHPTYVMGYLGLSFCYFDLKQFHLAYNTLRPFVETNRDNIRLQKIFADVCIEMGNSEEALDTYKYLLFINPRDKEVALRVSSLEKKIEDHYKPKHKPIYVPENLFSDDKKNKDYSLLFDIDKLQSKPNSTIEDYDDWISIDLTKDVKVQKENEVLENWNLKKTNEIFERNEPTHKVQENKLIFERDDEGNNENKFEKHEDFELSDQLSDIQVDFEKSLISENAPLVTHTLVDLYCGQGHIEKALEVLEKILELNPQDQRTKEKIEEIKNLISPDPSEDDNNYLDSSNVSQMFSPIVDTISSKPHLSNLQETSEEDGRKTLMSIFDKQISVPILDNLGPTKENNKQVNATLNHIIEEKLNLFLKKIQKRALDYQSRV